MSTIVRTGMPATPCCVATVTAPVNPAGARKFGFLPQQLSQAGPHVCPLHWIVKVPVPGGVPGLLAMRIIIGCPQYVSQFTVLCSPHALSSQQNASGPCGHPHPM